MSKRRRALDALAVLTALVCGDAVHWLITPHPGASGLRRAAVVAQLIVTLAVFVWIVRERRRLARRAARNAEPGRDATGAGSSPPRGT